MPVIYLLFESMLLLIRIKVIFLWIVSISENESLPPVEVKKNYRCHGSTVDFLINGDKDEKVKASLKDAELPQQFKAVEQFTDDDKNVVKKLIDAFIVKKQLQLMAS